MADAEENEVADAEEAAPGAIADSAKKHCSQAEETWEMACNMAPEVFAHIHKNSHRRWLYDEAPRAVGRKKKVG
eukprot:3930450-Amphidinium_carterae.1